MNSEIILTNIDKKFNSKEVIKSFNFTFKNKNFYKISGRNGSGKTTLLKIIKNIYFPDSGTIQFTNKELENISYIDNNPRSFFHRLQVIDNLVYFLSLNNPNYKNESIIELLNFFQLSKFKNKIFSDLSQGQMQAISIIRGLSYSPKVILFDESFSFLDKTFKSLIQDYIKKKINDDEGIVIFCSHEKDIFKSIDYEEILLK